MNQKKKENFSFSLIPKINLLNNHQDFKITQHDWSLNSNAIIID